MTQEARPTRLPDIADAKPKAPVIGVFAACDPRIDEDSRTRTQNVIEMVSRRISGAVVLPDGSPVPVVYSVTLIDGEAQADIVAQQFREAGVDILVCVPDTWAFPQLTTISLLQQFPADTPINITCGNSAPKPGVVYAHALNGAISQYGHMTALNVGTWPDEGMNPEMTEQTARDLIDWCYAAVTYLALRGRRVVVFGHDSMGMETALSHILPTRNTFGLEITRLDMKLLSDMLAKGAYDADELDALKGWLGGHLGDRIDLSQPNAAEKLDQSLAMYLIMRDLMRDLNAVGGGFMNQLEWGSDPRGVPLPICDMAESLMNSTFDHVGPKAVLPFATEADTQGLLTMLFMNWLSGGKPPLFMDFRKVWEARELQDLASSLGVAFSATDLWAQKGIVDGDNSGSASLDWAALPGASVDEIMRAVSMPGAELYYFPGGGNSVTFISPGGIEGIAGRLTYSGVSGLFSMIWDEACTVDLPNKVANAVATSSNVTWPHTWVVPKYATMAEYKQYAPANHFHMIPDLPVARLQHWMDLTGVMSVTPWAARPRQIEGVDRPQPLIHLINGGEDAYKLMRSRA
jgi:L-fucose isomerase